MNYALRLAALLIMVPLLQIPTAIGIADQIPEEAYKPLKLYDGKWEITEAGEKKEVTPLVNHCSRTGVFFVCEQVVKGKSEALVVFLPIGPLPDGAMEYRTHILFPDASSSKEWNKLTIAGEKWIYTWSSTEGGKTTQWRNINTFSGPDRIHFEVARSDDGATWVVQKSGDERRL